MDIIIHPIEAITFLILAHSLFILFTIGDWRNPQRLQKGSFSLVVSIIWLAVQLFFAFTLRFISVGGERIGLVFVTLISASVLSWNMVDRKLLKLARPDFAQNVYIIFCALVFWNFAWDQFPLLQNWIRLIVATAICLTLILLASLPVRLYLKRKAPDRYHFFF